MLGWSLARLGAVAAALCVVWTGAHAQTGAPPPDPRLGYGVFQQRCSTCHGNPAYERAPSPAALRAFAPERIYDALTTGVMKSVGDTLSDADKRLVAEAMSGRRIGSSASGDASAMKNRCPANPPLKAIAGPQWNGWGAGLSNTRFQPAASARLPAKDIPKLELKWAFGFPDGASAWGQPAVVGGRVYVGADTGFVYALDAKTGCVFWSFQALGGVRNAMTLGPVEGIPGVRQAVFFGDVKANVYALDAQTGRQLWVRHVEDQFTDRITAAPALYRGRLYVPVSSWEEYSARTLDYPCCTSVGSVVALEAGTGAQVWKTYVIPERPKVVGKNAKGVELWAPAGGAVWNTPTIDPKRHAIYVGTGDATTYPAAETSDAVMAMAMDMETGRILWSRQAHRNDSYLVGCVGGARTENCPKVQGPDWDIPASPILVEAGGGKQALIVGTKPGDILALDPDRKGEVLWRKNVSGGELAGDGPLPAGVRASGVLWGGAADVSKAYFGLTGGGLAAMSLKDGARAWLSPLNGGQAGRRVSNGAAATVIPGAVLVGGTDGVLFAVSSEDGRELWRFETAKPFATVNGVTAHGGSISAPGPVVVDGMVFVGSGYAATGTQPGNVLLAFGAAGKEARR